MAMQDALNPQGDGLRRSGFVYRPNDKVMQIKNNYDKEVFNGDIGIIEAVDLQDRTWLPLKGENISCTLLNHSKNHDITIVAILG